MRKLFHQITSTSFHRLVEEAVNQGKIPLGYTCGYVPQVMLSVGHLFPYRMRAPETTSTEIADIYLSNMGCGYTRSLLESAMDDQYHFLGGWVLAASCNQMHRLYDNLVYLLKPDFIHILDVPHKTGEAALNWYIEELRLLRKKMEAHFDVDMGDHALAQAIDRHNAFQSQLRAIGDLRLEIAPPLSGADYHDLLTAASTLPMDDMNAKIVEYHDLLKKAAPLKPHRARLMLVGGEMDDPEFIRTIEATGALVVADHMCTGSIPGMGVIESVNDPIRDIAVHYLRKISCPRMMENFSVRLGSILETAEKYQVEGIILHHIKFCDMWGVENRILMNAIKKTGIPTLCLEREYALTGEGQLKTRVQAFLERLGK